MGRWEQRCEQREMKKVQRGEGRGGGGKQLSFAESRTTEMAVQLMKPLYLRSSQPLWVFHPGL